MATQDYVSPLLGVAAGISFPSDGTLQVATAAGGFGFLLLGAAGATTGIKLTSSNGTLTVTGGDGAGSATVVASQIRSTAATTVNSAGTVGLGLQVGAGASGIYYNVTALSKAVSLTDVAGTGLAYVTQGQLTIAKTSNYTLIGAAAASNDNGAHFVNTGAAGAVAFTLPAAAQGLTYKFTCTAAQVLTVVAPAGSFFGPGSLVGTTRTITGTTAAQQYSSFTAVCYDGTNWVCREISGTVT